MSNPILPPPSTRFLAVDLHKDYAVFGGVNPQLDTVLSPRRIELPAWQKWAAANLKPTDLLVIESTSTAWDFYDQVSPLVSKVVVANPCLVKLISAGRVKTDKIDTMALARSPPPTSSPRCGFPRSLSATHAAYSLIAVDWFVTGPWSPTASIAFFFATTSPLRMAIPSRLPIFPGGRPFPFPPRRSCVSARISLSSSILLLKSLSLMPKLRVSPHRLPGRTKLLSSSNSRASALSSP